MHTRTVAVLGNYAPRCCGIATFTQDLRASLQANRPELAAPVTMTSDDAYDYIYPREVRQVILQEDRPAYRRAARAINASGAEVVTLQHEYGIFGGPDGVYLLDLLDQLRAPVVTTCHTVLKEPSPSQRSIMREIADASERLVVMTEKGREFLVDSYGIDPAKLSIIPHGIPDLRITDAEVAAQRQQLGWTGRKVILTFGLLSPNKGIEHAIRALPAIIDKFPDALYVVVGVTHPNLVRENGEAYREQLVALAKELGVFEHLQFINRFVSREELVRLINAADIYTTPYLNVAQITSGTLAYAFGLGKPVISTPYWHAEELLADGAGILVPFGSSEAQAEATLALLSDNDLRTRMSSRALEIGRKMRWREVGKVYLELLDECNGRRAENPVETPFRAPAQLRLA